ncbi:MAG: GDSL-type esterase/lipase family protein [Johnsonella sp.]|nr:GDSL-type esterase/lipase family protein [Johnsonella sp.]
MKRSNKHNNSFFLVLLLSMMTVAAPFIYYKIYQNKIAAFAQKEMIPETAAKESMAEESLPDKLIAKTGAEEGKEGEIRESLGRSEGIQEELPPEESTESLVFGEGKEESGAETKSGAESGQKQSAQEQSGEEAGAKQADASYFADALFIGDSRTVGLKEYGGIDNTTFFADTGMSVKDVVVKSYPVKGMGKVKLSDLLASRSFGKIYIMFGVNELGYPYEEFTQRYRGVLDMIREAQPDALIFLQGNLHVTEKKSTSSKIYTNEKLNEFNAFISSLADNQKIIYLDVNEIFDDEKGYLKGELSNDGVHIYGKHYKEWTDWILTKAR